MKAIQTLLLAISLLLTGCAMRPTAAPARRPVVVVPAPPQETAPDQGPDQGPEREPRRPDAPADEKPTPPAPAVVSQKPPILQPRPAAAPTRVPVLLYHDLAPGARGGNGVTIDVAEFEWQMAWLAQNGYTPVSTAQLIAWLNGKGQLPARPVIIQFDDGYRSNFTHALAIMKKHGMKGVQFLVSGLAGEPGFVSWAEARAMAASGVFEIQGHAHAGHAKTGGVANLVAWSGAEIRADYRTMAGHFADAGLAAPRSFAYPFGAHDDETVSALRAEGVEVAFTVEHGYVRQGDDPFRLSRLIVWPGLTGCQFAGLVRGEKVCQ